MKKVFIYSIFLLVIACSKSSNGNDNITSNSIAGKWHLKQIVENGATYIGTGYTCDTTMDITQYTSNGQVITKYSNNESPCTQLTDLGTYTFIDNIIDETQKNGNVIIWERKGIVTENTSTKLVVSIISQMEMMNSGTIHNTSYSMGQLVFTYEKVF